MQRNQTVWTFSTPIPTSPPREIWVSSAHLQHRWACLCAPAAAGLSAPSGWACIDSRPQRDTGTPAPWTHIHSISDKPARKPSRRDRWATANTHTHTRLISTVDRYHQSITFSFAPGGWSCDSNHRRHFQLRLWCIRQRTGHRKSVAGGLWPTRWLTSSESPDITSAQSCFLLKALSSRWASPRVVTCDINIHAHKDSKKKNLIKDVEDYSMSAFTLWCYQDTCPVQWGHAAC